MRAGRPVGKADERCEVRSADGRMFLEAGGRPDAYAAKSIGWRREKPPAGDAVVDEPALGTALRETSGDGRRVTFRFVAGDRLSSVSLFHLKGAVGEETVVRLRALAAALVAAAPRLPDTCEWLAARAAEALGAPASRAFPPSHGLCMVASDDGLARVSASAIAMDEPSSAVAGARKFLEPGDTAEPVPALGDALLVRGKAGSIARLHFACGRRYCMTGMARKGGLGAADLERLRALAAALCEAMGGAATK